MASKDSESKRRRRRVVALTVTVAYAVGTVMAVRRGYRFGAGVPVRCQQGHLFSTVWIPGASVKSLRLGLWRVQWCPVGRHVALVKLLRDADLSPEELASAAARHDVPVP